jgi:hypothetical protein
MDTKKVKGRLGYFFQEISIVVIGVLIAVSVGKYKESKDNETYLQKTLLAIENEIQLSQADLDTILTRHIDLLSILEENIEANESSLGELIKNQGGFQIPFLQNISLRFFVNNKAELLDFDLISQLLEIELKINLLSDNTSRLTDFVYENVNNSDVETIVKFRFLLASVVENEQALLESYQSFLEKNKIFLNGINPD